MASPPHAYSPAGSPPYSSAPLPSKKRASTSIDLSAQAPSMKRRKASIMSAASTSSAHPLRQTSFPPDESQTQGRTYSPSFKRSPSVDNMSFVSGSQASGAPGRKKRGRKSKAERANEAAAEAMRHGSPSVAGGRATAAQSVASGHDGGDDVEVEKDKEEEFEIPENMASVSTARTAQQIKEQQELNAFLKEQFDPVQFARYETWHRQTFRPADVKRHINSVTSQSCPVNVHQMMQSVLKQYVGDLIESALEIQEEWVALGEKQTDLPNDELEPTGELSQFRREAPLRPDHLREAYRRYRVAAEHNGSLGSLMVWNQQVQNGTERFAVRAGGRRIFK
ncbi:histone-fold-containing protein [Rostrohypoxylon terebratum]|nr:histone-fold-containing protein [Rostrohypoxylon terebratum]